MEQLFPSLPELPQYRRAVSAITQASNAVLFRVVEDLLEMVSPGRPQTSTTAMMEFERQQFLDQLLNARDGFVARHQRILLQVSRPTEMTETALRW